ncbi:hypothetical protein IW140_000083 [Coemansia sp. RSA 1813]|nr:hypothetical protein EV179_000382 [Coemansia sp. RSA 487]KAJ2573441.1 hypothetical protein IW140_000083 [Coemansia sp. RSA 1813]
MQNRVVSQSSRLLMRLGALSPRSNAAAHLRDAGRHISGSSSSRVCVSRPMSTEPATNANAIASDHRPTKEQRIQTLKDLGIQAYPRYTPPPAEFPLMDIPHVHEQWDSTLEKGAKLEDEQLSVQGRIHSKREASKRLFFIDIEQNGQTVQIAVSLKRNTGGMGDAESFTRHYRALLVGDIVRASGFVGKTNTGETSIFATRPMELLTTCLRTIPSRSGLVDIEKRFRKRHLDLLVNPHVKNALVVRAKVLSFIRSFLSSRQFVEVETPILSPSVGGASAKPFTTRSVAFGDTELFMRVAPELFLKQLVIGGMDKVYEIGKQFRNEGIDADHNPEFTTCEFYQAYATLEDLLQTTEEMLRGLVQTITGSFKLRVEGSPNSTHSQHHDVVDFAPPFRRINITETLRQKAPDLPSDLSDPTAIPQIMAIFKSQGIALPSPPTLPRLLDRLISHYIEPECTQPTFLVAHPSIMSPLSKPADLANTMSARFELFVNKLELVNAYEELNDPFVQRQNFSLQAGERDAGDDEIPAPDSAFCDALEYALPPTGGWGMGIDRVVALLAGVSHLRETMSFPIMRPQK